MPVAMYDTVTIEAVPSGARAVAGYVGGRWPTYWPLVARFPNALHLSIAIDAQEDAECLDIEAGDATPADAPAWVRRQLGRGVRRPVVYASLSLMPAVLSALERSGIAASEVRTWVAHYTGVSHICAADCGYGVSADATQWTDSAGGLNLDESLCADTFFGPPPPPPDPNHYEWYPTGPFSFRDETGRVVEVNERATVQQYDHLRIHPQMNAVRLAELRTLITFLRKRVWYVAHYDLHTGLEHPAPDWGSSRRGWRWQTLLARSRDEVVAKSSATAPHSSVAPAHSSAARLDSESMMRLDAMVRQADALLGMPYVWGGGHEGWGPQSGYDCSGFVSKVLHAGGLLSEPVTTDTLIGQPGIVSGQGEFVTIYDRARLTGAERQDEHVIMCINGQFYESGGMHGAWGGGGGVEKIGQPSVEYLGSFTNLLHPDGL